MPDCPNFPNIHESRLLLLWDSFGLHGLYLSNLIDLNYNSSQGNIQIDFYFLWMDMQKTAFQAFL